MSWSPGKRSRYYHRQRTGGVNKSAIAIVFLVLTLIGQAQKGHAQDVPVLTPGLTTGQCVKSTNTSEIGDAPCPGRVVVLPVASSYSLTNAECGSVVPGPGAGTTGPALVTMPSSPPANCEFTFRPATNGFYIDFNGKTALLPGDQNIVTQWTMPVVPAFRTHNPSISLQYNNSYWEESNVSSSIYETTVRPANTAQIAQG